MPFFIVYEDRVYVHALCAYSCRTFHEAVAHTYLYFLVNYKPQTRRMSIPPPLFVSDPVVVDTKDVPVQGKSLEKLRCYFRRDLKKGHECLKTHLFMVIVS